MKITARAKRVFLQTVIFQVEDEGEVFVCRLFKLPIDVVDQDYESFFDANMELILEHAKPVVEEARAAGVHHPVGVENEPLLVHVDFGK